MKKTDIMKMISENESLKEKLYSRGFVFTNCKYNDKEYPFYGLWNTVVINGYYMSVSPTQKFYINETDARTILLIGHAYNPIKLISDENLILEELSSKDTDSNEFFEILSELTGIFTLFVIASDKVYIFGDATCMQTTFYYNIGGNVCVSSHTNILEDLFNLEWDEYVKKLMSYRFFKLFGNSLPGDLTPYKEVKRLVPNHYVILSPEKTEIKRFYFPQKLNYSSDEIADRVSEILSANMKLIPLKWNKPAISLTGGCDSRTTLACTVGNYDKYKYFSFISSDAELVDAEAAKKICNSLGLKHKIYKVPDIDDELDLIKETGDLLRWNMGDILNCNKNDIRKRRFFSDVDDYDVEVKSWAAEIGRAYYSKRFAGRKEFGKNPNAHMCTILYKVFLNNRKLIKETDKVFEDYLAKYFQYTENSIEWQEQFFWEFRVASWNGLVITGEHRYSVDITIPYNNRKVLELLLSAPIDERINDSVYARIREKMNPAIDKTGISVTNIKHTKNRAVLENLYYTAHTFIK